MAGRRGSRERSYETSAAGGSSAGDRRPGRQRPVHLRGVRDHDRDRARRPRAGRDAGRDGRGGLRGHRARARSATSAAASVLRERLERHGLELAGGFIPLRLSEPRHHAEDLAVLAASLDAFNAGGAPRARPVLADAGSPERVARPGTGRRRPLAGPRRGRAGGTSPRASPRPSSCARARLRADVPPPRRHLRRGARGRSSGCSS